MPSGPARSLRSMEKPCLLGAWIDITERKRDNEIISRQAQEILEISAQTLVQLGVNLSNVNTRSSFSAGMLFALNLLNLRVVEQAWAAAMWLCDTEDNSSGTGRSIWRSCSGSWCSVFVGGVQRTIANLRRAYDTASAKSIVPSAFYDRFNKGLIAFSRSVCRTE